MIKHIILIGVVAHLTSFAQTTFYQCAGAAAYFVGQNEYSCNIPSTNFSINGTWNTFCYVAPQYGGLGSTGPTSPVTLSGNGQCGIPTEDIPNCPPDFTMNVAGLNWTVYAANQVVAFSFCVTSSTVFQTGSCNSQLCVTCGSGLYDECLSDADCNGVSWCDGLGCCEGESQGPDCSGAGEECDDDDDCCEDLACYGYTCSDLDPIILDLAGRGYQLTNVAGGVQFDFYGTGTPIQISWTAAGWNGGFLALDRNGNGRIDDATELFSNLSPQPTTPGKVGNGFLSLSVFDLPENGGNGDGWIDAEDAIFSKLLVWVDKNHNGISEPGELLTLKQAGIQAISLKDSLSKWKDAFGNTFRYSAQSRTNTSPNQVVYDVLLQSAGKATTTTAVTKQ